MILGISESKILDQGVSIHPAFFILTETLDGSTSDLKVICKGHLQK